ncbi:DUF2141 domain-containing protein [Croceibacterium sp. LX-88]|jgi:uncharacterized protein (DUF2141 family)|uniref:DUF2141 domain-containing protein n=1 Tax=Croceibacterium selenioxidans TaxID=2838833 RepID=A0ABS5W857_9SPHN|nr:DUF2141 domain-containing protein [Croceibacterium selenioxidans]MBT2135375.1 DUF2141 domain-containing protein [Croceibacterium selenioxidans]
MVKPGYINCVKAVTWGLNGLALAGLLVAAPLQAQYKQKIGNDMSRCRGAGPAVSVRVTGIKSGEGTVRAQIYRATKQDWLESGRWLYRIELPAKAGSMTFCLPVPEPGNFAVAVRHDVNNNDKTDLTQDGGGASNNPAYTIFNLGKPSYTKTSFPVGKEVKSITINLHYM